jgi:hypothetical protein
MKKIIDVSQTWILWTDWWPLNFKCVGVTKAINLHLFCVTAYIRRRNSFGGQIGFRILPFSASWYVMKVTDYNFINEQIKSFAQTSVEKYSEYS